MSDSITIDEILQSWLTAHSIGDNAVLQQWLGAMSLQRMDKGEFVVRAGMHSRHLYFIHSGLLRLYYTSTEGKERNKAFYGP